MRNIRLSLVLTMAALLVSACATGPAPEMKTDKNGGGGFSDTVIKTLAGELSDAKSNDVDVLAPDIFKKAEAAFTKAKQGLEKGARTTTIDKHVADTRKYLAQAVALAEKARRILADTNAAREKAVAAGAQDLGPAFQEVEANWAKLTKAIKDNDLRYAQDHAGEVQESFHRVEIMAIKHRALDPCRRLLEKVEARNVEKIAPKSLQQAHGALDEADDFIGKNPYDHQAIAEKAGHALFMVQRLTAVVDLAQKLDPLSTENRVLFVEDRISQLSTSLDAGDLRNLPFDEQIGRLTTAVEKLKTDNRSLSELNQSYQTQVAALEKRIKGLQGFSEEQEAAKQRLAAQRAFNERFDMVQNYFTDREAEVYKQGNQLVIRLRGIKFPVGQATLTTENYSLLSKVQRAIRTFESATVLIEGHTDSTGSAELNQTLSLERAKAVQAYLVANDAGMVGRISARGYGSDRPLATNDTPEGRAINRRIDVLITPTPVP